MNDYQTAAYAILAIAVLAVVKMLLSKRPRRTPKGW